MGGPPARMKGCIPPPSPPITAWPDQSPRSTSNLVSPTIEEDGGVPLKKTPTWNVDGRFDASSHVVHNKQESPTNVPSAAQIARKTDGGKVSKPAAPSKMSSLVSVEETPMMVSPTRPAMVVLGQGSPERTSSRSDPAQATFQSPPPKTITTPTSTNKVSFSAVHPGLGNRQDLSSGTFLLVI